VLLLATDHPQALERVGVQASFQQRHGGRSWSAFQFEDDGTPWALEDRDTREAFVHDAIGILNLPDHRKREADWYTSCRVHPITGEDTEITHATIYVEDRAASELAFGTTEGLEQQVFQRVMEVGIACDPKSRIVEICTRGGKKVRDQCSEVFSKHFAPDASLPVETPRRDVVLETLRTQPSFLIEPSDGVDRVEVSSLDLFQQVVGLPGSSGAVRTRRSTSSCPASLARLLPSPHVAGSSPVPLCGFSLPHGKASVRRP